MALAATTKNPDSPPNKTQKEPPTKAALPAAESGSFEILGTVIYQDMEGGFYAINADNGKKYNPTNLSESFKKDGLKIKATARLNTDSMSIQMYGQLIDVLSIETR